MKRMARTRVGFPSKGILFYLAIVLFLYGCSGREEQQLPKITFVENMGTKDGMPVYSDSLHIKTDARQGFIEVLTQKAYEEEKSKGFFDARTWSRDTYPIAGQGVVSIPLNKYKSSAGQKLWVRAAAPADEHVIKGSSLDRILYSLVGVPIDQTKHKKVIRIEEESRGKVYYFYYLGDPEPFLIENKSLSFRGDDAKKEVAGVFRFILPPGFRPVSKEKLRALKQAMLQEGAALARSSGLADAQGYALGDVAAYESSDGAYILTLISKEEKNQVSQEDVWKTNIERVEWGKNTGRLLSRSKVATGQIFDGHPVIFTEIFNQSGEGRMQSYDIFVSQQPRHRHTISLIHTKGEFKEQMVKDFLASMTIVVPSKR